MALLRLSAGLLSIPYVVAVFFLGWMTTHWWAPLAAALVGLSLYLLLPGRAEQVGSILYANHTSYINFWGALFAPLRMSGGFWKLIFALYLSQVIVAMIVYWLGYGVRAVVH